MFSQFKIQPKNVIKVADFMLVDTQIILNQGAQINYSLCEENGSTIKYGNLELTKEQYDNWGTDDLYIVNLICAAEGLTLA